MGKFFDSKLRKFVVDPPGFMEGFLKSHHPYMGTVKPAEDFNDKAAKARASELKAACDGLGTNEAVVIDILTHHSNKQRQDIKTAFKNLFDKDLECELKSELSGHFQDVIVALLAPPPIYDARELRKAVQGAGTDEDTIIEIMITRSNKEIKSIKGAYTHEFERDLEKDLKDDTSGCFQNLLVSLCNGSRNESGKVHKDKAEADAKAIYETEKGKWGTEEAAINDIFATRNFDQLVEIFKAFKKLSEQEIEVAIEKECAGDQQDSLLAIASFARNKWRFFSARLHKALEGAGTDEKTLIRIMVSRSEVDLAAIAELYLMDYEKNLFEDIAADTSGDFKKTLLALLGDLAE